MLIYKVQRVVRAKSHSHALACSMCQFGMENCNLCVQKWPRFAIFIFLFIIKSPKMQLYWLRGLVRPLKSQKIENLGLIF